jgi:hypothetical protein
VTWLSVVLVGLGVADLIRSSSWRHSRLVAHVAGPLVVVVVAVVAGLRSWPDVVALALALVACAAWMQLSHHAQLTGRRSLAALTVFGAVVVGLLLFSGAASRPGGLLETWLHWADLPGGTSHSPARVLLIAGLVSFNVATANVIVRLVLVVIGALPPGARTAQGSAAASVPVGVPGGAPTAGGSAGPSIGPADRLKGGRLLGPMERLVILGLGLAGELGAAGIVIAAKGLLRFPEVQAAARTSGPGGSYGGGPAGIDDVTEYFLVGSFVSWLIALTTLAFAH